MKRKTSRRDFARALAMAGASALLPVSLASQGTAPGATAAIQNPQQETKPSPQAEAMLQLLKTKYPDRLDADQQKRALTNFQNSLRASERMSKSDLKNSDEPDFIFSAGKPARPNQARWKRALPGTRRES